MLGLTFHLFLIDMGVCVYHSTHSTDEKMDIWFVVGVENIDLYWRRSMDCDLSGN